MKGQSYRPLADMHSDGVYFNEESVEMELLLLVGDESLCQYSGLPSVKTYEEKAELE